MVGRDPRSISADTRGLIHSRYWDSLERASDR